MQTVIEPKTAHAHAHAHAHAIGNGKASTAPDLTLDALSADLEEYVQLFNGPQATIAVAVQDLVRDATRRSLVACLVVSALLLQVTREAINSCECSGGCPSCVHSPKCGNGNEPLDKVAAITLLDALLSQSPC